MQYSRYFIMTRVPVWEGMGGELSVESEVQAM